MSKIYLPSTISNSNCAYIYDKDTIRVYDSHPQVNTTISYTDYFINSDYITRTGSTTFTQYSTLNYNCLNYQDFTTNAVYRTDFYKSFLLFFLFVLLAWFICSKVYRRLCYGRKNY